MLSARNRFHGCGSLRYLFKNGKTSRNRTLLVRYSVNPQRTESRVAIIVGKKVAKAAVVRNRIRRRIFEILRQDWDQIAPGYDISITVFSRELATMPHDELLRTVNGVMKQAGLYSKQGRSSDTLDTTI